MSVPLSNVLEYKPNIVSYLQASAQPIDSETHGGDDVGIWAVGPMSHLVTGVHQQSFIAQVMSYSACIGPHDNDQCKINRNMRSGAGHLVRKKDNSQVSHDINITVLQNLSISIILAVSMMFVF